MSVTALATDQAPNGAASPASIDDIEQLYRSGFHRYLRVAEAIAGSPESGLDAVQEGFARAIRGRDGFRGEAKLSTWVWSCVVNAAKATPRPPALQLVEETVDAAAPESPPQTLAGLIASLPERQRLALFLRYYADMDYRAIASVLRVRVGTVGATLNKAQASLRRQLEEVSR